MLAVQDAIDIAVEEGFSAQAIAIGVEMSGKRPRAHWLTVEAAQRQLVDDPDDRGFVFDNEQASTLLAPFDRDCAGLVAKRHRSAVPVARACIAATVTPGEERRIKRVLLVQNRCHRAHELAVGIVGKTLGERDQSDARLAELVLADHLGEQPASEAREGENDDLVDRVLRARRLEDHPVELPPLQLAAGDVELLEDLDDLDILTLGIGPDCGDLCCDAGVVACLLVDRNPDIAVGSQVVGHGQNPLSVGGH